MGLVQLMLDMNVDCDLFRVVGTNFVSMGISIVLDAAIFGYDHPWSLKKINFHQ